MEQEFEFSDLLTAMGELAQRSLGTIVPVFFGLFALGFGVDYFLQDQWGGTLIVAVGQFVISYFLVVGLARHAGLLEDGRTGPGFGSYFGLSFMMGLGTALGFLLLFIPGIVLTVRWLLAFPILFSPDDYAEGGKGALGQSWEMSGPVFWKLLAAWIVGLLLAGVSMYAYLTWGVSLERSTMLIGFAVANVAVALNTIYTLILGFAAFLLLRSTRAEIERIFA